MTFLLVGLGNPGSAYKSTRHNVGFMAVDVISHRHNFSAPKAKFKAECKEGEIEGMKVLALKPMTYMNLSGQSVREAAGFYKIPLEHIIVIHDDLDLPLCKVRIKTGGGHGGHNGLRSLDAQLGKEYTRIRIGIGRPDDRNQVSDYVLQDFSKKECDHVEMLLVQLSDVIGHVLKGDAASCMNRLIAVKNDL